MSQVERVTPAERMLDEGTGELIERSDGPAVAALLKKISDFERNYKQAKRWCVDALLERCDARKEWTTTIGGVHVTADPPSASTVEWDWNLLRTLVQHLPEERYLELCRPTLVLEPDTRKLQAIAKSDPDSTVGQIIKQAEGRKPRYRGVRVS